MNQIRFSVADGAGWLTECEIKQAMAKHGDLLTVVKKGEEKYRDSLGWLDPDQWASDNWLTAYEDLAKRVQEIADVLVVIGIGGSNQAARAVADAIGEKSGVEIVWAGNNISAHSVQQVLTSLEGKRVCINVIAKNFETLEPGLSFRILRKYLKDIYGEKYAQRVICTGTRGAHLEEIAKQYGFAFLPFPENIGGRFTALSPIALFPLAVAGMDIRAMVAGAKKMREELLAENSGDSVALRYAVIRNLLFEKGFRMEMLSFFEPRWFRFAKWWMQLFGESEGKDNKGLYPVFGNFSEDLHSIGQFLQDGTPVIFETFLEVADSGASYIVESDGIDDRFHYLDGMDVDQINRVACEATIQAHSEKYPCVRLTVPAINEETFGKLFYFFAFVCYLSAKIFGVNPFDQPGVEAYKVNMFHALGK